MIRKVCGVAVNDVDGASVRSKDVVVRGLYIVWYNMIQRCCSSLHRNKYPTYADCAVRDEWLNLSGFMRWARPRYQPGLELDKDILSAGCKIYSPETCAFVPRDLNRFLLDGKQSDRGLPVGVSRHKKTGRLVAQCSNPFLSRREHIGLFDDAAEAHLAWRSRKHELACQWAELIDDERVKAALRTRFAPVVECEAA